jgi:nicotinamide-nucleotide amidase
MFDNEPRTEATRMFPNDIQALAAQVLDKARARGWKVAAAESCTGGLVLGARTAIAGSSDVVEGGLVTYANAAKHRLLGVPEEVLASHGSVSEPTARAMAEGALVALDADLSVAITGVAGPGGGSAEKPVGLVCFATAVRGGATVHRETRFGDLGREAVRLASIRTALEMLLERLG